MKTTQRAINEIKAYLGVLKILYPNIKQPYKRWYEKQNIIK